MTSSRRGPARRWVVASVLIPLLAACSGGGEAPGGEGPTQSASVQPDDGGTVAVGTDGLPESYPRDAAPVIEGRVLSVVEPREGDNAYVLLLVVPDQSRSAAVTQAVGLLEDAGWSARTDPEGEPPAPQVLVKGSGQVILTNGVQRGETSLTYSVVPS